MIKVVVLLSRVPYPLDKGDKLRAYHQIKELSKSYELKVIALDDIGVKQNVIRHLQSEFDFEVIELSKIKIYFNLISGLFSSKPFQVHYFYQRSANKKIKSIIESFKPAHIYCQLIRTSEYVKNIHNIPKTIDYMDAFSKGMDRRAKDSSFFTKPFVKAEASRLLKYENLIFDYFENKTIISEQDQSLIYHSERNDIVVVPNGVDFEFFKPREAALKEYDLVFTGNMNYPPNVNGALFLVNEILPLLIEKNPDFKLLIAGVNPAASVSALTSKNVEVSGWMDDIRDAYASAKVFIAPMRIGTGLQNKLLEAMAMDIPAVTTPLANDALNATHKKTILVGKSKEELANFVLQLLEDENEASRMAKEAGDYVRSNFSWHSATELLSNLINARK
jgi:sugar transferase (PEP-CTERM/EpsH1 system associated)